MIHEQDALWSSLLGSWMLLVTRIQISRYPNIQISKYSQIGIQVGAKYVAVDVMGKRQTKQTAARRAVVALRVDNTVLAVKLQYADSTSEWTMPWPGGLEN